MAISVSLVAILATLVGVYRLFFTEDVPGGVCLLLRGIFLLVIIILFGTYKHHKNCKKRPK